MFSIKSKPVMPDVVPMKKLFVLAAIDCYCIHLLPGQQCCARQSWSCTSITGSVQKEHQQGIRILFDSSLVPDARASTQARPHGFD